MDAWVDIRKGMQGNDGHPHHQQQRRRNRVRENGLKGLATQYVHAKMAAGLATIPKMHVRRLRQHGGRRTDDGPTLHVGPKRIAITSPIRYSRGKHETLRGKT